jgi:hypothetical protein
VIPTWGKVFKVGPISFRWDVHDYTAQALTWQVQLTLKRLVVTLIYTLRI